ncbi:uncharacterized protein L3040_001685 [Drepanopeziza brunnea f. sp. 'multigermtubi']|uniref:Uncharacterized protein n=1 Tax=Marssonina brunnea f. sp. multigermtubi (strain MB_m1) TaxID=1072389 RepID=K1X3M4_MARBU|nr:uncharacterized protein MBM_06534 [Drepanopeziza brunnea f. sp. 'multigermtubi' MB_m1]EKD15318.1 hypothetical protein MBM_06534 [Drepanopeziza brunnea f. sp. 'multigermtubi' MB_m1]KAJ5051922.1 hypothetical protein L3040_001685 [Drepanopeziza brunnea f. sp. 'multigermtubi']
MLLLKGKTRHVLITLSSIIFIAVLGNFHNTLLSIPVTRIISNSQHSFPQPFNIDSPINLDGTKKHTVLRSVSTPDGRYFDVKFGDHNGSANVNFVPHPHWNDTWVIVAQKPKSKIPQTVWFAEIVCNAQFTAARVLSCIEPPGILPVTATAGDKCRGTKLDYLENSIGPRDARIFYGPKSPYVIFGSNGVETACMGMWIEDFRVLVDWGLESYDDTKYRHATKLRRPGTYTGMEKNWFVFWDFQGNYYAHYHVSPRRAFAQLNNDGSVGEDLASRATTDEQCLEARMPAATRDHEEIHQATNSLAVTMCKRADPACQATAQNTFIFTLFHYKSYYQYHGEYEPYVMMFRQSAPFDLHSISEKPLWIHGRGGEGTGKKHANWKEGLGKWTQTEMVYVTSIAWKQKGLKYHGYLDDVLLIGFGVEDEHAGGIDVVVGDLFENLAPCYGL